MKTKIKQNRDFLNTVTQMTASVSCKLTLSITEESDNVEIKENHVYCGGDSFLNGFVDITDCSKGITLSLLEHNQDSEVEKTKERNIHKIDTLIYNLQVFRANYLLLLDEYIKNNETKTSQCPQANKD